MVKQSLNVVFLVAALLVPFGDCRSDITRATQCLVHFQYQIETNLFTKAAKPNVQFRASVDGMPDLPKWLRLEQKTPTAPAFIYGTPKEQDVGEVFLEIIGWNKDDYSTAKKIMRITIEAKQASQVKYQVDFKISNFDLADFLLRDKYRSFAQEVQDIWTNAYIVTKIDKTVNRPGGRYTPTGVKEGVFITIGAGKPPPDALKNARYCAPQSPKPASQSVYNKFSKGEFTVSWCHLSSLELSLTSAGKQVPQPKKPEDDFTKTEYKTVKYDAGRNDLSTDWIYVCIPVLIGFIFIVVLTYVMCCNRQGSAKRDAMTPREQLEHHRSLRRATYRMRNMNSSNAPSDEAPGNGSYTYGRLEEDNDRSTLKPRGADRNPNQSLPSTPGTNQRSTVPPPYRMPPSLPSDQASDTDSLPSGPPPYKRPEEGRW
ncbi:alpha-sarcoglycan-like [Rhopilema esculentum]|uniref:alpha-sarcoglycan-like n=1 Tax=Rhopilema esculentum TaxID=499914 RepID=UPI0031E208A3